MVLVDAGRCFQSSGEARCRKQYRNGSVCFDILSDTSGLVADNAGAAYMKGSGGFSNGIQDQAVAIKLFQ